MLFFSLKNRLFFVVVGCKSNLVILFVNTLFDPQMTTFAYVIDFMMIIKC